MATEPTTPTEPLRGNSMREAIAFAFALHRAGGEAHEEIAETLDVLVSSTRDDFLERADRLLAPLWAAHVRGPDDIIPVRSYADAVVLCDALRAVDDRVNAGVAPESVVRTSALPALWPYAADTHAARLAERAAPGSEYPLQPGEGGFVR